MPGVHSGGQKCRPLSLNGLKMPAADAKCRGEDVEVYGNAGVGPRYNDKDIAPSPRMPCRASYQSKYAQQGSAVGGPIRGAEQGVAEVGRPGASMVSTKATYSMPAQRKKSEAERTL